MKIEDTPFQFTVQSDGARVHRVVGSSSQGFDAIDLAFLDLLGNVSEGNRKQDAKAAVQEYLKTDDVKKSSEDTTSNENKAVDYDKKATIESKSVRSLESDDIIKKELALLKAVLSNQDVMFLKNAVIPGLPILAGNVPLNQIFPRQGDGSLDLRGYTISGKLSELIEKGHATGRPIRVEVDENSSLILRIRNGRVSADFISNDRAAAFYIKQQLDELRQRMSSKNLPVGDLAYHENEQEDPRHFGRSNQDDDDDFIWD